MFLARSHIWFNRSAACSARSAMPDKRLLPLRQSTSADQCAICLEPLASHEALFLRGKLVWANWDAEELVSRAEEIKNSLLLKVLVSGVAM